MTFEQAINSDITELTYLRTAYLQEDFEKIDEKDLQSIKRNLPAYFEKHLNKDLFAYIARDSGEIVSCAFLLVIEKPMSPAFMTGKTGTVLNVYTKPEYRHKGCAKKLMTMLLEDATTKELSVVDLKSTEDGYNLYKTLGFEDVVSKYHVMRFVCKK